jgi:hypothetical protein
MPVARRNESSTARPAAYRSGAARTAAGDIPSDSVLGGTTLFWVWPEQEIVVALTANLSEAPLGGRAFAERLGVPFLEAEDTD